MIELCGAAGGAGAPVECLATLSKVLGALLAQPDEPRVRQVRPQSRAPEQ